MLQYKSICRNINNKNIHHFIFFTIVYSFTKMNFVWNYKHAI